MASKLRVPHTLILLFGIMVLAWLLTLILPPGSFQTEPNEHGKELVVPGTYQVGTENKRLTPIVLLTSIPRGLEKSQDVIFFVLLIGGVIALLRRSGTVDAAIGWALKRFGGQVAWLLLTAMLIFSIFSSTFGMAEEYLAFVGILVAMCVALKLDAIVAVGVMVIGYGIGYGCAIINPFTVVIAQDIAGLETGSGWLFRLVMTLPFLLVGYHHLWSYARRVQRDPQASYLVDQPESQSSGTTVNRCVDYPSITSVHLIVLGCMVALIAALFYGVMYRGWYLTELSALFLGFGIVVATLARFSFQEIGETFIGGAAELTGTAILIGFARAITVILEDGGVMHTIVFHLANLLNYLPRELSAIGMLLIQHLLNFFIPSGSGQAYVTMPIMAPVGDVVGVSRQVAVLAFQFGDGFTNMIVPTNAVLMGILGLANVPYESWFKFIFPLIIKLFLVAAVALVVAVRIGLQ